MAKVSVLQPSFSGGEFGPLVQGRTDSERAKTGLQTCVNYIPTIQGPLLRAPGTKYVGDAKDPSKPPILIPFKFSQTQQYMLEVGERYIRFWNEAGQFVTSGTSYIVRGAYAIEPSNLAGGGITYLFQSARPGAVGEFNEYITVQSSVVSGSILEVPTSYSFEHLSGLKFQQKDDTLYIEHPNYYTRKIQRRANNHWTITDVPFVDGPYLPLNSYRSTGDSTNISFALSSNADEFMIETRPRLNISNIGTSSIGAIRVFSSGHGLATGQRVFITGVAGTGEANNAGTVMEWPISVVSSSAFDLVGSVLTNPYIGSGTWQPALFADQGLGQWNPDWGRTMALYQGGVKYYGYLVNSALNGASKARFKLHPDNPALPNSSAVSVWQIGEWGGSVITWGPSLLGTAYQVNSNSYPSCGAFHQDRLFLSGALRSPQEINGSMTGQYERFSANGTSLVVADNHAMQFKLLSQQINPIYWLKSDNQGLLAGSMHGEWKVSPNNNAGALSPTNISAVETSSFGSADIDAVRAANATLYVQEAQRRLRELNYFFQVDSYRSTDLSELAGHLTAPAVTALAVQKETVPVVWALKSDGTLASMSYNRDDTTLKAGWANRVLGGYSDSAGSPPRVKAISVIAASSGLYQQLWMAVQRYVNGTSVVTIEATKEFFDNKIAQEDAYHVDCGATYDNPKNITNITIAGSCIVTAASHGFANGDTIRIDDVIGLNSSITDVNSIVFNSNLVNAHTFLAGSVSTNAFFLQTFNSSYIDSRGYSPYVSGGKARKLVSTISGLTWLNGETVSIWADGKIHSPVVVGAGGGGAGSIALQFPAAKAQIGYGMKSFGQTLRQDAGSTDGTSIGKKRSPFKVAFQLDRVAEFSFGANSNRMTPFEFNKTPAADIMPPLFTGIVRESVKAAHDFDGRICFEQTSPSPGMVQAVVTVMEENDI